MMRPRPTRKIVFYGVIAFLMLAELFLSNIGSLMNLEATAAAVGLTPDAERSRLFTLILFDALAGVGALLAIWAFLRPAPASLGRVGAWLVVAGMVLYGLYQVYSALFLLAPDWRPGVLSIGVVYVLLGIAAWRWAGRELL